MIQIFKTVNYLMMIFWSGKIGCPTISKLEYRYVATQLSQDNCVSREKYNRRFRFHNELIFTVTSTAPNPTPTSLWGTSFQMRV